MSLADLTAPEAVHRALHEFDDLGRDRFLEKYGFSRSRSYFLVRDGKAYDSKAIAGAAHGYQHPQLGPLKAAEFSGGDATVRARLEALGFSVVVTEPRTGPVRPLVLWEDYGRRDVHDIFAPDSDFTPGGGLWGIQGIVEHQPGEFLIFVTFGRKQGQHQFDEGITSTGVLTWQSQPEQGLDDPQVKALIAHNSERNNVLLFLRTSGRVAGQVRPYTYLGRLEYLTHDVERERPVYFQWQLIDTFPPPESVLARMGLVLTPPESQVVQSGTILASAPGLVETPPPAGSERSGKRTADFRGRISPDRSKQDAKNRALGLAGELAVVTHEQTWLRANGRNDLAELVRHVAVVEGDGAGYDVESFSLDGSAKFIEVKTTRDGLDTPFYVSTNEIEFSRTHARQYVLYRIYAFDPALGNGHFYVKSGSLGEAPDVALEPVVFRARVQAASSMNVVTPDLSETSILQPSAQSQGT
jgi:hypothetical protein